MLPTLGSAGVPQSKWPNISEGFARKLIVPSGTSPKSGLQVFDDALPGFGIRKFPNGKAVFFVKYRVGSQQRRLVLGSALVPGVLAATRRKAAAILMKARAGEDLVQETRAAEVRKGGARSPKQFEDPQQPGARATSKRVGQSLALAAMSRSSGTSATMRAIARQGHQSNHQGGRSRPHRGSEGGQRSSGRRLRTGVAHHVLHVGHGP